MRSQESEDRSQKAGGRKKSSFHIGCSMFDVRLHARRSHKLRRLGSHSFLLLGCTSLLLSSSFSQARVFEQRPMGTLNSDAYAAMGWQAVYESDMTINGQAAEVEMWQSEQFPEQALHQLEQTYQRT